MFELKVDPAQNLLRMTYRDHVDLVELVNGRPQVTAALAQLRPGFRLLTDLSELDSMDYACAPEIQAVMDLFREKGVGEVVRVVPDPRKDIGFRLMSYFHYDRTTPVRTFETRAEALEKLLA